MSTKNTDLGGKIAWDCLKKANRVAMVGIGGVGMYSIARLLLRQGKTVLGQDTKENPYTIHLKEQGCALFYHDKALPLLPGDAVVYTLAVPPLHPTLQKAKELQLPLLSRADALAGLMQKSTPRVAVAGMHGKSTTTAILGHLLVECNFSPTLVCGATMAKWNSPLLFGERAFVFEACEYMRSFLSFSPEVSLLLNMEWEHVDCYPTFQSVKDAFFQFAQKSGKLVLCYDDLNLRPLAKGKETLFYSLSDSGADFYAKDLTATLGGYTFTLCQNRAPIGEVSLPLTGEMNVSNAIGAGATAVMLGASPLAVCQSLSSVQGVKRRLERRGFLENSPIFDDYAHHPTEISASLLTLKGMTKGKIRVVFQPHTYSRTKALFPALVKSLSLADEVVVAEIFPARETDTLGVTAKGVADALGEKGHYFPHLSEIAEFLLSGIKKEDTVVIMGAGDIDRIFSFLPVSPSQKDR